MVRRTHSCRRCGAAIDPGDVYSAVDVLDAEGRLRELLCRECGADLRSFVTDGEGGAAREWDVHDGDGERGRDCGSERDGERETDPE